MAYGAAVMTVWSGTHFFAVWYGLGAACLVAAALVHFGVWESLPVIARRVVEAIAASITACILVAGGFAVSGMNSGKVAESEDLDCIIVLGAQVRSDGPSSVLRYRLDTAYDYLTTHETTRCIVSGGQGANEPATEASIMRDYLVGRGISPDRIVVEDQSRNTAENIRRSMAFVDPATDRIGIVTSDFHVFRACRLARKQGMANICGIPAPSTPFYLPNNLLRESLGIVKDFAVGNL